MQIAKISGQLLASTILKIQLMPKQKELLTPKSQKADASQDNSAPQYHHIDSNNKTAALN